MGRRQLLGLTIFSSRFSHGDFQRSVSVFGKAEDFANLNLSLTSGTLLNTN